MAGKVKLKTRRVGISSEWTTVVVDDVTGEEVLPHKRVTNIGLIICDTMEYIDGVKVFHETRDDARAVVRKLQERFPNTEYVGGLH